MFLLHFRILFSILSAQCLMFLHNHCFVGQVCLCLSYLPLITSKTFYGCALNVKFFYKGMSCTCILSKLEKTFRSPSPQCQWNHLIFIQEFWFSFSSKWQAPYRDGTYIKALTKLWSFSPVERQQGSHLPAWLLMIRLMRWLMNAHVK